MLIWGKPHSLSPPAPAGLPAEPSLPPQRHLHWLFLAGATRTKWRVFWRFRVGEKETAKKDGWRGHRAQGTHCRVAARLLLGNPTPARLPGSSHIPTLGLLSACPSRCLEILPRVRIAPWTTRFGELTALNRCSHLPVFTRHWARPQVGC